MRKVILAKVPNCRQEFEQWNFLYESHHYVSCFHNFTIWGIGKGWYLGFFFFFFFFANSFIYKFINSSVDSFILFLVFFYKNLYS